MHDMRMKHMTENEIYNQKANSNSFQIMTSVNWKLIFVHISFKHPGSIRHKPGFAQSQCGWSRFSGKKRNKAPTTVHSRSRPRRFTGVICSFLQCQPPGFKHAACSCWANVKSLFHYKTSPLMAQSDSSIGRQAFLIWKQQLKGTFEFQQHTWRSRDISVENLFKKRKRKRGGIFAATHSRCTPARIPANPFYIQMCLGPNTSASAPHYMKLMKE